MCTQRNNFKRTDFFFSEPTIWKFNFIFLKYSGAILKDQFLFISTNHLKIVSASIIWELNFFHCSETLRNSFKGPTSSSQHQLVEQRPARFSFLENSREFVFFFTSRSRSRAVSISLSLLEKEWRDFIFHFSLLEKSESYPYFTLFSREKRVKSGAG